MTQNTNNITNERLKLWLSFIKFLLGTVALGLASVVINAEIQSREITLKEQEHLAKFIDTALKEDIGPRMLMAQYFSKVTQSKTLKSGWADYYSTLSAEAENKRNEISAIKKRLIELETIIESQSSTDIVRITTLAEIRSLRETLIKLDSELDPRGQLVPSAIIDILAPPSAVRQAQAFCAGGIDITVHLDSSGIPNSISQTPSFKTKGLPIEEAKKVMADARKCMKDRIGIEQLREAASR